MPLDDLYTYIYNYIYLDRLDQIRLNQITFDQIRLDYIRFDSIRLDRQSRLDQIRLDQIGQKEQSRLDQIRLDRQIDLVPEAFGGSPGYTRGISVVYEAAACKKHEQLFISIVANYGEKL